MTLATFLDSRGLMPPLPGLDGERPAFYPTACAVGHMTSPLAGLCPQHGNRYRVCAGRFSNFQFRFSSFLFRLLIADG
jgi:hypothetical protein